MATVYVDVKPSIITWVVKQLDGKVISDKLMQNIEHWLSGTKKPTFHQIEELSRKSNIPLGYFFLQNPMKEKNPLLEYRTCDSIHLENPSRELIDTIHQMESVQAWMKEYFQEEGFARNPYVASLKDITQKKQIVEKIRQDLDLKLDWYNDCRDSDGAFKKVRHQLEKCNVLVLMNGCVGQNTHRSLNLQEFRAFAMVDDFAPLIFINSKDSSAGRLFSLLHEVVHIWLGKNDLFNSFDSGEKAIEVLCNAVAGEILVPNEKFLEQWNLILEDNLLEKIQNIAKRFCCSNIVIARKALNNNKISKNNYNYVVKKTLEDFFKSKKKKSSGGNFYATLTSKLDAGLVRALVSSINIGKTSYTEAYKLTNTNSKTFNEVATALGGY